LSNGQVESSTICPHRYIEPSLPAQCSLFVEADRAQVSVRRASGARCPSQGYAVFWGLGRPDSFALTVRLTRTNARAARGRGRPR